MSTLSAQGRLPRRLSPAGDGSRGAIRETWIAVALVVVAGAAVVLGAGAFAAGMSSVALVWGAIALAGFAALMATGWVSPVLLVTLTLPLPAIVQTESLRIATVAPVTAAAVAAWILGLGAAGRTARLGRLPRNTLAFLLAVFVLTTVTAQHPITSIRETANFGVLLAFLLLATDAFAERRTLPRLADTLIALAALCGALGVLETLGVLPSEFPRYDLNYNRAALGFGQPNGLGLFMAASLPFTVHRFRTERDGPARALLAAAGLLAIAGLVASFSRGSWLALLAGTAALLFTGDARLVLRIWLATFVLAFVIDVVSGGALRETVTRTIGDWVIEQRAALMLAGVAMFFAYPLTGVGAGGYAESLDRFGPQIPQLWDYLPTPHNAYVQMAAETGIVGLLAFVIWIIITLRMQIRRTRREDRDPAVSVEERSMNRALLWAFGTAAAAGMVVWPLAHGTGQAVMLVAAGIYATPARRT